MKDILYFQWFFTLLTYVLLLLFNDKIKMARKPGKKQKEDPVGCTGEGKRWEGNIREGLRKVKTETVMELNLEADLTGLNQMI